MTLRIAVVGACPYPVPQGSQVYLRQTALMLRDCGHEVHLVVYGYGVGEDESGLPVHRSANPFGAARMAAGPSIVKPLLDCSLVRTLRRLVREHRIDVVYAHNYEGLIVALAARKRPIIYQAHNAMADELPYYFRARRVTARVGGWLDRTFPRRADRIIVPHAALAQYLIACGCTPARVTCIPPPADVDAFSSDEPVEATTTAVLYTGNLDAYQNLDLLRRAMRRVRSAMPDAKLIVATAASPEKAVQAGFSEAEVIATPDLASLRTVLAADVVVACPRVSWSGYPIKLLNAMAAGKAAVACRSAAHPLEDGTTGLIVDDDDEEAFAGALLRLISDGGLRTRLGAAARHAARTRHDPARISDALRHVVEDACRLNTAAD
jgi:glycosyltransferase involved in cell wall biosynthesis